MASTVALIGGGIKGAVAAARFAPSSELALVHVDFGQPSSETEANAASLLARSFPNARVIKLDLPHAARLDRMKERPAPRPGPRQSRAASTGAPSAASLQGLMPVLLSVGVQCALRIGARRVVTGLVGQVDASHAGLTLVEGQPGRCREFIHAFNLMSEGLYPQRTSIHVEAPLIDLGYPEVVKLAFHFQLPVEDLWSCQRAGPRPCRRCRSCTTRARAFADARLDDPLFVPTEV
ncbi:MAG: 7-cyano-7-deazaguanine synthase [Phycisphaerales bacterium]|nr:MAG: 7-cyano-7-deazaguanine synthase [Phycisphaerales bacterium]